MTSQMGRKRTGQIKSLSGNRFEITIQTKKNGKRGYFGEVVTGTLEDAQGRLSACLERLEYLEQNPEKTTTVNQLMRDFIDNDAKHKIKERTLLDYENCLRRYITPTIGERLFSEMKIKDFKQMYIGLRDEKKLSSSVIRKVHFQLKSALSYAVEMELADTNPLMFMKPPKIGAVRETQIPSIDETLILFNACRNNQERALWMTAYFTGMRPEEYLALRWDDLDFKKKIFKINRVVVQLPKKRLIFDEPKTKKSRRNQPMTDELVEVLNEHRKSWATLKISKGEKWSNLDNEKDLVFCTENGNVLLNSNLNRHFKNLIARANSEDEKNYWGRNLKQITIDKPFLLISNPQKVRTDISPYSLRHAFGSHLLETGATLKDVSDLLGHSSIRLTADTYVHLTEQRKSDSVENLSRTVLKRVA